MSSLLLKTVHISSATGSYILFFLRGIWSLNGSAIMSQRWIKIVPHVVDTLLIVSAITLAFSIRQYPFVNAWLTAKVIALLLYIGPVSYTHLLQVAAHLLLSSHRRHDW